MHEAHELVIGVITQMVPRPALTPEEAAAWPPGLAALLATCLEELPDDRPHFGPLLDALDAILPPRDRALGRRKWCVGGRHGRGTARAARACRPLPCPTRARSGSLRVRIRSPRGNQQRAASGIAVELAARRRC